MFNSHGIKKVLDSDWFRGSENYSNCVRVHVWNRTNRTKLRIFCSEDGVFVQTLHNLGANGPGILLSILWMVEDCNVNDWLKKDAWAVCAQIVDYLYKYTVFRAKNSEICPIRPIPNVHAHTIGIVFASSKPIGIGYCFDDVWIKRLRVNGAQLNDWIYWWTIEFIQFNFSIAHRWRKDGCQRAYKLGLEQLSSYTRHIIIVLVQFFCIILCKYKIRITHVRSRTVWA